MSFDHFLRCGRIIDNAEYIYNKHAIPRSMGARRGGQEGALAPPWKFTDMGGPPKDNLTRNLKKKLRGPI